MELVRYIVHFVNLARLAYFLVVVIAVISTRLQLTISVRRDHIRICLLVRNLLRPLPVVRGGVMATVKELGTHLRYSIYSERR